MANVNLHYLTQCYLNWTDDGTVIIVQCMNNKILSLYDIFQYIHLRKPTHHVNDKIYTETSRNFVKIKLCAKMRIQRFCIQFSFGMKFLIILNKLSKGLIQLDEIFFTGIFLRWLEKFPWKVFVYNVHWSHEFENWHWNILRRVEIFEILNKNVYFVATCIRDRARILECKKLLDANLIRLMADNSINEIVWTRKEKLV
jgi:hypothetical protein